MQNSNPVLTMIKYILLSFIFLVFFAPNNLGATEEQYFATLNRLEKRVAKEKKAYQYEKDGKFNEAIYIFSQVADEYGSSAVASPSRNALIRLYEQTAQYDKALEQVEWFLSGNQTEQGRACSLADKQRLIAKIEAQKRETEPMASTSDTQLPPIKNIADFTKASYGDQKRYMEEKLPENTAILKLSKQAMLAEHAGDFKSAKESYEALLAQERAVTAAQGEVAWVMLHCAVQRTSEVTGDEVREKEMLVWIRDCMLVPDGQHHKYLNGLMPSVQDHLKERLRKFGLTS
ncbi:MAG: tetratricopeptide repeat protein [Candidatus Omnitrophota bacterium]